MLMLLIYCLQYYQYGICGCFRQIYSQNGMLIGTGYSLQYIPYVFILRFQ